MTHSRHVNYVHTSSKQKYDCELCINEPTLLFICHDCPIKKNIYPTSFLEPKDFPTLSYNLSVSSMPIVEQEEQFFHKKSCMSTIIAKSDSVKTNAFGTAPQNMNDKNKTCSNSNISFLSDNNKNLKSTYVFEESKDEEFCNSYSIDKFSAYAVIHPKCEVNFKIKSSSSKFAIFDIKKSKINVDKQIIIVANSVIHVVFPNPKISNDLELTVNSINEEIINSYKIQVLSDKQQNFFIKKNNKSIKSSDLLLVNNQKFVAELGGIINHIPGIMTKIDSCVDNLESPSCINQRNIKILQLQNPILNSMIMQCRFLYSSGNIFIPNDEPIPEILLQASLNNNKINKLQNHQYMCLINSHASLLGINKKVCTISINDNSKNNLWSMFMFFNNPSEGNIESILMPIILKSEKNQVFLIHNLSPHQVYIIPNTRRNIYVYIKDNKETIGEAFEKVTSSKINQISTSKLFFFYQRCNSNIIITITKSEDTYKVTCLSCNIIFPRELSSTTDSIKSEIINTSNNMFTFIYENKYSPFILTNQQKISFK